VRLKPAPTEPTDLRFPINLAAALRLSDARPVIVAAAQASVWVAEADLSQARVLWVPTLNLGFDYIRHDGGGPDFNKGILTSVSTNFFYASGGLTGPGTGIIPTTDAIFQPLVARQVLNAGHWDIQTAKNDALMRTADAYFLVHQHRGTCAGTLYCVERGHELVERIAAPSHDLVPEFEVERAQHGRRVQPGAVRPVPCAGLPRPRDRAPRAPRQRRAGRPGTAVLPAPGGPRAAPGDPMTAAGIDRRSRRGGPCAHLVN
jgi:hypothetical protein